MDSNRVFNSVLAAYMRGYIAEKESLCQNTESSYWCLHEFDKYLIEIGHTSPSISKRTYDGWLEWASINRKKIYDTLQGSNPHIVYEIYVLNGK